MRKFFICLLFLSPFLSLAEKPPESSSPSIMDSVVDSVVDFPCFDDSLDTTNVSELWERADYFKDQIPAEFDHYINDQFHFERCIRSDWSHRRCDNKKRAIFNDSKFMAMREAQKARQAGTCAIEYYQWAEAAQHVTREYRNLETKERLIAYRALAIELRQNATRLWQETVELWQEAADLSQKANELKEKSNQLFKEAYNLNMEWGRRDPDLRRTCETASAHVLVNRFLGNTDPLVALFDSSSRRLPYVKGAERLDRQGVILRIQAQDSSREAQQTKRSAILREAEAIEYEMQAIVAEQWVIKLAQEIDTGGENSSEAEQN